jgi:predicted lipoprotein with Yx(FWY)xxD motif
MSSRKVARLVLVALMSAALGIAAEATAFAASAGKNAAAVDAKKKRKPTVKVAETDLGEILVDSKGRTLYSFDPDGTNIDVSNCTGGCEQAWPHLTSKKKPKAGKGLDKELLELGADDQVAYNGHLLYRFSGDTAPGDTTGQGVGGVWHVVGADGEPITT